MRTRPGYSLAEMLVGLVVASIVGASLIQLMTVQSQFFHRQEGRSNARAVSRSATNIMISDIRLVEPSGGVVAAAPKSIEVRVPFAIGIVCTSGGGNTVVAFAPMDSVVWSEGVTGNAIDGYAWRNSDTNPFTYQPGAVSIGGAAVGTCTGAGITPIAGSRVSTVTPEATGAFTGAPFFMYQRVVYSFNNSVSVPGRTGLWRTMPNRSLTEEIVAPFDTTARFRFYVAGSNVPQATPPSPLSDMRGLELQLTALNERASSAVAAELTPLTTAVFFKNQ